MTLPLPTYDGTSETLQFILDLIANAAIDTGGRQIKLRYGSSTTTYPGGSAVSGTQTVTHGMGSTPISVVAVENGSVYSSPLVFSLTSTTFQWKVRTYDGTSPAAAATDGIYWIAIG